MIAELQKHLVYWFEDGSLLLNAQGIQFRIHRSLVQRHSAYLASAELSVQSVPPVFMVDGTHDLVASITSDDRQINARDLEALLEHMYHDFPLSPNSPFDRITAVLRSSSPQQLDMPVLHAQAKEYLCSFFSRNNPSDIDVDTIPEALLLGRTYQLPLVIKVALYRIMVTSSLDLDDEAPLDPQSRGRSDSAAPDSLDSLKARNLKTRNLTPEDMNICKKLMARVIDHFTPILFTPATALHMACTDVLADTWMSLVVSPAIENGGVYKPIETLERMKGLAWDKHGLCPVCVVDKREEWSEEQKNVWALIGSWLEKEG